jgi:predicted Zn-dependent protease
MAAAPQAAPPRSAPPTREETLLTPLPEGAPSHPEAARFVESARLLLRARQPAKALPLLEAAGTLEPAHPGIQRLLLQTRAEARRSEIESLTASALDHFVKNKYKKAREAVEKALVLDPGNRKAKDLLKILAPLA